MVRTHVSRRSGIFLTELMIAILLFALASALCVRIFVRAQQISTQAQELSEGVNRCSCAAELLRSASSGENARQLLTQRLGMEKVDTNLFQLEAETGTLQVQTGREGELFTAHILWINLRGESVYDLTVERWIPEVNP